MADPQERARRRALLAEVRRVGGEMSTGQAHAFYRATGHSPCRTTARRGVLVERGPGNARTYTLKGGTR